MALVGMVFSTWDGSLLSPLVDLRGRDVLLYWKS
jgi:hypothetical protein